MKKMGLIMIALVLALGMAGVGYAMWQDTVTIDGSVTTGSVDLDIDSLSHTYIYKVIQAFGNYSVADMICADGPMVLDQNPNDNDGDELIEVASAVTTGAVSSDANYDEDAESVTMTFTNIFPTVTCNISADVVLHYVGSVPAHVVKSAETWGGTDAAALAAEQMEKWELSTDDGVTWTEVQLETLQLHNCYLVRYTKWFDLSEQEAADMGLGPATFTFTISAQQWNE
jgi:hypothetical protein